MAELVVLVIIAFFFGWTAWTVWGVKQTLNKVMLDEAWRTVLNDPHYKERRHLEERRHAKAKARFNAPHGDPRTIPLTPLCPRTMALSWIDRRSQ